jgi:hypothetical protein
MLVAKLPTLPKGKEFEEFLAAFLQAHGYYVERNIIDRQEEEVLELDIISSQYEKGQGPESRLYEVKSGSWGFSEIFKIRGWLDYLHLDSGCLLVQQERTPLDFYQKIAAALNVEVVTIPSVKKATECLKTIIKPENINPIDISTWRFSYWTERQLLRLLTVKKKSTKDKKCYAALDCYFSLINNRTFFTRNVVERAQKLYEIYQEYPNISAKMGHELHGENFDEEYTNVPPSLYEEAYYACKLNDLAVSSFVEYRARFAILRSAIDYTIFKETGSDHNQTSVIKFEDLQFEYTLLDMLPHSFKEGLKEIAHHPYFYRYPIFWQWFLWVFGGFVLKDYQEKDYALLSAKTGIPLEEIPRALESYEILFPSSDSWFIESQSTNIKMLKLFPTPFMGIGANYRRLMYTKDRKWEGLQLTGLHTHNDLLKWNNVLVNLIIRQL